MRTEWSRRALRTLEEFAERRGQAWAERMVARVEQLEAFPDSGRIVPEFGNRYIRELIEGDYRIIYERFADRIEVIGVIHGYRSFSQGETQE